MSSFVEFGRMFWFDWLVCVCDRVLLRRHSCGLLEEVQEENGELKYRALDFGPDFKRNQCDAQQVENRAQRYQGRKYTDFRDEWVDPLDKNKRFWVVM